MEALASSRRFIDAARISEFCIWFASCSQAAKCASMALRTELPADCSEPFAPETTPTVALYWLKSARGSEPPPSANDLSVAVSLSMSERAVADVLTKPSRLDISESVRETPPFEAHPTATIATQASSQARTLMDISSWNRCLPPGSHRRTARRVPRRPGWRQRGTEPPGTRFRTRVRTVAPAEVRGRLLAQPRPQLLHGLVDRERGGALARWELLERLEERADDRGGRERDPRFRHDPVPVGVRGDVGALVGIGAEVEELREPQRRERLRPHLQRPLAALLDEDELPVLVPQADHVAVVVEVEELLPRALRLLAGEVGELVEAVEVHLEVLARGVRTLQELLLRIRVARCRQQGRHPVERAHDLVADRPGRDVARPAEDARHPERALPVGVLLAAERRRPAVGPRVGVGAVVGRVQQDR